MKKIYYIRSNAFDTIVGTDDSTGRAWYVHLDAVAGDEYEADKRLTDMMDGSTWEELYNYYDNADYRNIVADLDGSDIIAEIVVPGLSDYEIEQIAASLYDGGWRSNDRELMHEEFSDGLAPADIDAIINILKSYEEDENNA